MPLDEAFGALALVVGFVIFMVFVLNDRDFKRRSLKYAVPALGGCFFVMLLSIEGLFQFTVVFIIGAGFTALIYFMLKRLFK